MPTITKKAFVDTLSKDGGNIDLNKLDAATKKTLADNGVTDEKLRSIAGQDSVIRGNDEMKALFDYVDGFDKNGDSGSIRIRREFSTPAVRCVAAF